MEEVDGVDEVDWVDEMDRVDWVGRVEDWYCFSQARMTSRRARVRFPSRRSWRLWTLDVQKVSEGKRGE